MKSKKKLINPGRLVSNEIQNNVPSLGELAISKLNKNIFTTINPCYFTNHNHFIKSDPMPPITHTLNSVGQTSESILSIIPFFGRIMEYDRKELNNFLRQLPD